MWRPKSTQIWKPKEYNNLDLLPNELIYQICQDMKTKDLVAFSKSSKRVSQVCHDILKERRQKESLVFHFSEVINLKRNDITFYRNLDGLLTSARILQPGIESNLFENQIFRMNTSGRSNLPIKQLEMESVISGNATIRSEFYDNYRLVTMEFIDGYISSIVKLSISASNLIYNNGMPLFKTDSGEIELIGSVPLFNYIFKGKSDIINNFDPIDIIEFSYFYNHKKQMYSFTQLIIPLTKGVTYQYSRESDNTLDIPPDNIDTFFLFYNNDLTGEYKEIPLTKSEIEKETGFAMEVHPGSMRFAIPKGADFIISQYLYEIALFIDYYPISSFFNILRS